MLIQLDIENVAVIERASIEFGNGLNIITGETGAGKSLLINSLNMVLGSRSNRDLIREGAEYARVSGIFFCMEIDELLSENEITTDDGNIIITRKLYRDGRNVCHINGCAVNVSVLKSIGEHLVVIHGQHDSAVIMDTSSHIHFLDAFAKNSDLLADYRNVYKNLRELQDQLDKMNSDEAARRNEIDYLTYQTNEIEKANLSVEEEDVLSERKTILENAESLSAHSESAYSLLNGNSGITDSLYGVRRALEKLSTIDSSTEELLSRAESIYYEADELSRDLSSYISKIEYNPSESEKINDRLNVIRSLKRKYNTDVSGIIEFYETASERLCFLNSFDENKEKLEKNIESLLAEAQKLATAITKTRIEGAKLLSERITKELESLDMEKCVIEFSLTPVPLNENGGETVELLISTNPLEPPKNLAKIASGGEISRVMLAIKSVFSDFDAVSTLLFDEIDTGVSGRAAEKIGIKMKALSEKFQIISVTHLPVIASFAKTHFLLEKIFEGSGFKTEIRNLTYNERINEIARIISGDNIQSVSLDNARQMLIHNNPELTESEEI